MDKKAISVYNPSDPIERSIQEQYHKISGEWLGSYQCKILAKTITALKIFDEQWIESPELLEQRISYFFAPFMSQKKTSLVFMTVPLFFRDIIENCEINSYLHNPIAFVTRPLAFYLFQEYPIHIYVDTSKMKGANNIDWVDIGGLLVADNDNVNIDSCITHISVKDLRYKHLVSQVMQDQQQQDIPLLKAAISQISPGIFKIDRHDRILEPDNLVWDKDQRKTAVITQIEPGETGSITLEYENGAEVSIPMQQFDTKYSPYVINEEI